MSETRRASKLTSLVAAGLMALAVGCSSPSAPNQTANPDDGEPEDGQSTSLLVPARECPAPGLLSVHDLRLG